MSGRKSRGNIVIGRTGDAMRRGEAGEQDIIRGQRRAQIFKIS